MKSGYPEPRVPLISVPCICHSDYPDPAGINIYRTNHAIIAYFSQNRFLAYAHMSLSDMSNMSPIDFTAFSNIVNGEFRGAKIFYNGIDPATKKKLWDVPVATERDLDDAVEAANTAHRSWSRIPINERGRLLQTFSEEFIKYESHFSELLTKENGRPVGPSNNSLLQPLTTLPLPRHRWHYGKFR